MITGNPNSRIVRVDGVELDPYPSQKLAYHSPDGFSWGYSGSGPAQLALAILLHYTDKKFALEQYQYFKFDVIAACPQNSTLNIPTRDVKEWITSHGGTINDRSTATHGPGHRPLGHVPLKRR